MRESWPARRGFLIAAVACAAIAGVGCGSQTTALSRTSAAVRPRGPVKFVPIAGGPHYFANKSAASAWMDRHILIGAWLEQPQSAAEVGYDAAMGENFYWNLAGSAGKDRVDYNVIRAGEMHVAAPSTTSNSGAETVAYDGSDESDMNYGAGAGGWANSGTYNQSACIPAGSACGYTVARFYYTGQPSSDGSPEYPITGLPIHQGFGKGVLFWRPKREATRFLDFSDILSADSYWNTDSSLEVASQGGCGLLPYNPTACGNSGASGLTSAQSQLPANYAYDVTRLEQIQAINGASKPAVVDVETGCPFQSGACSTPPQTIAAAWHALIAGARGIVWFQHNFSGPCIDFRTFIDGSNPTTAKYNCQQTPGVTLHRLVQDLGAFDHEVARLNDVLLSPTAEGYVSSGGDVSTLAKVYAGSCYVFAGSGRQAVPPPSNQAVEFMLFDQYTGPVKVYDENRTLRARKGVFRDTFVNANSVHIYRIRGAATCRSGSRHGR